MDVRVGLWRKQSAKELMLLSCGVGKTLEGPLDCKDIKPVNPKGNQSWLFIGRIYAEAEALILWPPDAKNWLTGKDPDAGKDWRRENGTTEDEMAGWHHHSMDKSLLKLPELGMGWGWTGRPGMLQSMELQRVRHNCADLMLPNLQNFHLILGNYPCLTLGKTNLLLHETEICVAAIKL